MSPAGTESWSPAPGIAPAPRFDVPVSVTLGGPLTEVLGDGGEIELRRQVRDRLDAVLRGWGVPGTPVVDVGEHDGARALQLHVHDRLVPYPPGLMKRIWLATCPDQLAEVCLASPEGSVGFPDAWLHSHASASLDEGSGRLVLIRYLAELASEAVARRPSCVLPTSPWEGYFRDSVAPFVPELLQLGISLNRAPEIQEEVERAALGGLPDSAWLREEMFARVAPDAIEVVVAPDHLHHAGLGSQLPGRTSVYDNEKVSQQLQTAFASVEEALYSELGMVLPDLVFVPDDDLARGRLSVRLNDRTNPPFPTPRPDEHFVADGSVEALGVAGINARPALHPRDFQRYAVIDSADAEAASAAGFTIWDAAEFTAYCVAFEVRRAAAWLLTMHYVEWKLAQLEESHPQLVGLAREEGRIAPEELTFVLRELLREGLPVSDLRLIVDQLLSYQPLPVDPDTHHLFDVRHPVARLAERSDVRGPNLVEAVRAGMKNQIGHKLGYGTGTLVVYLLDSGIEAEAAELSDDDGEASEKLAEMLRELCWAELSHLPPLARRPAILTTAGARRWVRRALEPELPQMSVLTYLELPHDVNVMPIARIAPDS